jgi:hypothetical protein
MGRFAGEVSLVPDLPPTPLGMDRLWGTQGGVGSAGRGSAKRGQLDLSEYIIDGTFEVA